MIVRTRSYTPTFDRNIDRAFDQLTSSFFEPRRTAGPAVNGAWDDDEYVLTVDLPGVPARAVDVNVAGTTLTIAVDHEDVQWQRSLRLGGSLSPDKVEARYVDGRLTVRVGRHDEPEARSIEIATATQAIEASSDAADEPGNDADESTES